MSKAKKPAKKAPKKTATQAPKQATKAKSSKATLRVVEEAEEKEYQYGAEGLTDDEIKEFEHFLNTISARVEAQAKGDVWPLDRLEYELTFAKEMLQDYIYNWQKELTDRLGVSMQILNDPGR
jgi:hypothetical protein